LARTSDASIAINLALMVASDSVADVNRTLVVLDDTDAPGCIGIWAGQKLQTLRTSSQYRYQMIMLKLEASRLLKQRVAAPSS